MPRILRPALSVGMMVVSVYAAAIGLVSLIAQGYGLLTYAFIAVDSAGANSGRLENHPARECVGNMNK